MVTTRERVRRMVRGHGPAPGPAVSGDGRCTSGPALAALGRREDALTAIDEAVAHYRDLPDKHHVFPRRVSPDH